MPLTRNIISFVLALLLANPACCCVQGACRAPDKEPARSCCSSSSDQENGRDKENGHTCMCSQKNEYPDFKAFHFQPTDFSPATENPTTQQEQGYLSRSCHVIVSSTVHPPPGYSLCILYSTFRL
ncbi:MAG: hypothetical protein ACPH5P_06265 [Akkermansiaceae bacterium]